MTEPICDMDGYPTEETLSKIKYWRGSIKSWFEFIAETWHWPEFFEIEGESVKASTGGWSGNEDVIDAMAGNTAYWTITWRSSKWGGHHEFEIPKEK